MTINFSFILASNNETFLTSDPLYFTYLLQVGSKEESKVLKDKTCIYYLVIVKISKKTRIIPINDLIGEIIMDTKDFTKELIIESGIDEEKEELLGVENIIKVVDLERKLSVLKVDLEDEKKLHEEIVKQKDKAIEEKDKQLDDKDKKIERLKAQLKDEKIN